MTFAPGWTGRIPCAVLGATGSVGQRFVTLLAEHPWFELTRLCASPRNVGKPYGEATRWVQACACPEAVATMELVPAEEPADEVALVFSSMDREVAGPIEVAWANAGKLVVSNAASHRMDPDVPLVVPEVNPGHLALMDTQPYAGGILTNPNCSTIGLVLALAPLERAFGVKRLHVVTLQALSGAGVPGVSSMEAIDNLIPFIPTEEQKLATESAKILGTLEAGAITPAKLVLSAQCNRVAVLDGHTECVSIELGREATIEEVRAAWDEFRSEPQELGLPSAPEIPTRYLEAEDAPQPRRHRDLDKGMACVIGRLQPCPVLGWRFVCLSHNTLRGAAGGAVLLAELAVAQGRLPM
ncbi:MAG: aspartate-semialdehyde dehydrogenase [Planctomycetota bacterium]|nr:aspartate-semialdehyde dehydrogenase [Planctomycetota bacterium]